MKRGAFHADPRILRTAVGFAICLIIAVFLVFTGTRSAVPSRTDSEINFSSDAFRYSSVPEFSGNPYVAVNGNVPYFTEEETGASKPYEYYSELDSLGRCGVAMSLVGKETMPTEARGSISSVKPTGWHSTEYSFVESGRLYNRCHLIGYQLTGENANGKNLITGTRYMNVVGMLPFENMVADYVKETGEKVLYRVTPVFSGDDLVARGVLMEGLSVADGGEAICFCVFCYNVQPGVIIDYRTGDSRSDLESYAPDEVADYILNINSRKFHRPECELAKDIKEANRKEYKGSRQILIDSGYSPCKNCKP